MNASVATLMLLGLWLAIGGATAAALHKRGQPALTALTAVIAWPVLVPLLTDGGSTLGSGPYAQRIQSCFNALRSALREDATTGIVTNEELDALERALQRADARIAMVDRLLSEDALRADPMSEQLTRARGFAGDEIEAVLRGVVQLRVQVGLVALAGDTVPVRDRMAELGARVRALEELSLA